MNIELTKEQILMEIKQNFQDDVDFIMEIVDKNTNSWQSVRNVTKKLIELLKKNDELSDLLEPVL